MSPSNSARKWRFFSRSSGTVVRGLPNDPADKQDLSRWLLIAKGEAGLPSPECGECSISILLFRRRETMVLPMRTGVQALADTPVSELLEQWIGEQLGRGDAARGARPRIGVLAAAGALREGGWPVYGSDAPTMHAILEAG